MDAAPRRMPLVRRALKAILGVYARLYHHLEFEEFENVPPRGPAIVVVNHTSRFTNNSCLIGPPTNFVNHGVQSKDRAATLRFAAQSLHQ